MIINNYEPILNHSSNVRLVNGIDAWNSVNFTFKNGPAIKCFHKFRYNRIFGTLFFCVVYDIIINHVNVCI